MKQFGERKKSSGGKNRTRPGEATPDGGTPPRGTPLPRLAGTLTTLTPYSLGACSPPPLRVYWGLRPYGRVCAVSGCRGSRACGYTSGASLPTTPAPSPAPDCGCLEILLALSFYYLILLFDDRGTLHVAANCMLFLSVAFLCRVFPGA